MREKIEALLRDYSEFETEHRILEERFHQAIRRNEEYQEYIDRLKHKCDELKNMNASLEEELDSCNERIKDLYGKIEKCSAERSMLGNENKRLHRDNDELLQLIVPNREFDISSLTSFTNLIKKRVCLDEYYGVIGVLFADYDSIPVKEYIAEHLMLFNSQSADYIDFLLPGYSNEVQSNKKDCIVDNVSLNGKQLYFDSVAFSKSVLNYRRTFGLDYLDRPILILHELNSGRVSPRRIILELEYKEINSCSRTPKILCSVRRSTTRSFTSL